MGKRKRIIEPLDDLDRFLSDGGCGRIKKTFLFELITPMIGGDSKSWHLDMEHPVRNQSVKGQLRFWWRSLQNERDVKTLLYKENALWGGKFKSASDDDPRVIQKSDVRLSITHQEVVEKEPIPSDNANKTMSRIHDYLLFPLRAEKDAQMMIRLSFSLHISYSSPHDADVLDTLKLWTLFGGIGARTRRGLGALYCSGLLEEFTSSEELIQWVKKKSGGDTCPLKYPRMAGAMLAIRPSKDTPSSSLYQMITAYQKFRQDRPERKGTSPFGRSRWPEPDAIRTITGVHSTHHAPRHDDKIWFPRAAFGLPIQFSFKTPGDPEKLMLSVNIRGGGEGRLPSPVILKAIRIASGETLCIALVLNQEFPSNLKLAIPSKPDYPLKQEALPFAPGYQKVKKMNQNEILNDRSIYQVLFGHLGLEEVLP